MHARAKERARERKRHGQDGGFVVLIVYMLINALLSLYWSLTLVAAMASTSKVVLPDVKFTGREDIRNFCGSLIFMLNYTSGTTKK